MKYGYFEENEVIPPIINFIDGAHILVKCSVSKYVLTTIRLEDLGWEVRDSIKILLKNKSLQVGVLRKPFKGTVANNVLTNGCGGLNIDACRIGQFTNTTPSGMVRWNDFRHGDDKYPTEETVNVKEGRFPANLLLELSSANMMDSQSGERKGWRSQNHNNFNMYGGNALIDSKTTREGFHEGYNDSGGASRFFYNFKSEAEMRAYLINLIKV